MCVQCNYDKRVHVCSVCHFNTNAHPRYHCLLTDIWFFLRIMCDPTLWRNYTLSVCAKRKRNIEKYTYIAIFLNLAHSYAMNDLWCFYYCDFMLVRPGSCETCDTYFFFLIVFWLHFFFLLVMYSCDANLLIRTVLVLVSFFLQVNKKKTHGGTHLNY